MQKKITLVMILFLMVTTIKAGGFEIDESRLKEIKLKPYQTVEGTLILSDSPENVKGEGILYEEEAKGKGRFIYHHLNENEKHLNARFLILAKNTSSKSEVVIIKYDVFKGPTKNILHEGQQLLKDYMRSAHHAYYVLEPGQEIVIYDTMGQCVKSTKTSMYCEDEREKLYKPWSFNTLVTGMFDFETTQTTLFRTIALNADNRSCKHLEELPYLEKDEHPRGTFKELDRHYKLKVDKNEAYKLVIEGNDRNWSRGKDRITKEKAINIGNYGIMYYITVEAQADTMIVMCPRAGVFKGCVSFLDGEMSQIERAHHFKLQKEVVPVGEVKAHTTRTLKYMLPNGSAAPIWIVFYT